PAVESGIVSVAPELEWLAAPQGAATGDNCRVSGGDRIWMIAESSGTTGKPKLLGVSHYIEEAQGARQAQLFAHRPEERFLNFPGMRFLIPIKPAIRCLSKGGPLTFPPAGLNHEELLQWIDRHNIAYISCVPSHLYQLLREIKGDGPRLPLLRILRC